MVKRVMGTETEYGIYSTDDPTANPIALSTLAVETYAYRYRGSWPSVAWDYRGEDPLNDVRGMRLDRASADASMLTDDPYHLAPSGGVEYLRPLSEAESRLSRASSIVLANGARFYVDHAHPEYSSPETASAKDAVLWDRAGDEVARRAMAWYPTFEERTRISASAPESLVFVKNNVDGKGATYGSHENYLVERGADLDDLIRFMIPFLVTRPIFCGAGRVGLGQRSELPGFQISQRADYVENDIGLETTFNRPIFNTRDEPHANHHYWRRIHVIGGDANQFDISTFLRLGTTALLLRVLERGTDMSWDTLDMLNPIEAAALVSRDLTLSNPLPMRSGQAWSALEIQRRYFELVIEGIARHELELSDDEQMVLDRWNSVLTRMSKDMFSVSREVEWVAKLLLLERQRQRLDTNWSDPRLAAFDLQWGDLRPDKSLITRLDAAGQIERLWSKDQVRWAADNPPADTRASLRGESVSSREDLVAASWTSLVFEEEVDEILVAPEQANGREQSGAKIVRRVRIPIPEPTSPRGYSDSATSNATDT